MTKSNHVKYLESDGRKNLDLTWLKKSRMLWVKLSEQFQWEFRRPECQQNVDSEGRTHEVSYENTDYLGNWMDYRPFYVTSWQKKKAKNQQLYLILSMSWAFVESCLRQKYKLIWKKEVLTGLVVRLCHGFCLYSGS